MQAQYWHDGQWGPAREISVPIGLHGLWNGSSVFDGARAIGGRLPDLLAHCQRLVAAAPSMLLAAPLPAEDIAAICLEGVRRFPPEAELYVMPLLYATRGGLIPEAEATALMVQVFESPVLRTPFAACHEAESVRPAPGSMQTDFKASWLYASAAPSRARARARGFDDAVMCDPSGAVVEFSTANLWIVQEGVIRTPAINGSFLPGITRARLLSLLRAAGVAVEEARLTRADLDAASEIFSTGNSNQLRRLGRLEDRRLPPGPVFDTAARLYDTWLEGQRL